MNWSDRQIVGYHTADCGDLRLMVNETQWVVRVGLNQESGK
jgi:hypothetical protein